MPIEMKKGDVVKAFRNGDFNVLAHGCNCSGGFGSGVAKQIGMAYPQVRGAYLNHYDEGLCRLGEVQIVAGGFGNAIANCFTQEKYGRDGKLYLDYDALGNCMLYLRSIFSFPDEIGMPKIGCGLAGGEWRKVKKILNEVFDDRTIYVYDL